MSAIFNPTDEIRVGMSADSATSTSVTLANVGQGLTVDLAPNEKCDLFISVTFETAATTTGIGLSINGSTAATSVQGYFRISLSLATGGYSGLAAYDGFTATASIDTMNAPRTAKGFVSIVNGASASTINLRYATEVAGSGVIIRQNGTYMIKKTLP